jgi:signal peptidase I
MSDHRDIPSTLVAPAPPVYVEAAAAGTRVETNFATASAALPPGHPRSPESHGMIHAVQSLLYIIIIAIFIITFIVQPFRIPSESMDPTLLVGDFLLVAKQNVPVTASLPLPATPIRRGDVIVFHYPVDPAIHLVKRVIGLPGDHLRLHDNRVYINGRALIEPYAVYRPGPPDNFRDNFPRLANPDPDVASAWWIQMRSLVNHGELTVPPHSFFVLGDNRNDSEDSRYWGFVPASAIVGKPLLIYFSVNSSPHPDDDDDTRGSTADSRDPDPTPRASALASLKPAKPSPLGEIANFARWDRTLHVVR